LSSDRQNCLRHFSFADGRGRSTRTDNNKEVVNDSE
jgi:hypothetical protein